MGEVPALPNPAAVSDEELDELLAERQRRRQREAATRMNNAGHEVIRSEPVPGETEAERELFGYSRPAEPDRSARDYGTRRYEQEP